MTYELDELARATGPKAVAYREQVVPLLLRVKEICERHGMSIVGAVELDPMPDGLGAYIGTFSHVPPPGVMRSERFALALALLRNVEVESVATGAVVSDGCPFCASGLPHPTPHNSN